MNVELQFVRAMVGYALARAHTQRARGRSQFARNQIGASALEWAIISAILVAAALAIGVVVRSVIDKRKAEIEKG